MRSFFLSATIALASAAPALAQPVYTEAARQADSQLNGTLRSKVAKKYDYFAPTRDSLTAAFRDSTCVWALLDAEGNELLLPRYSQIRLLGAGLLSATRGGKTSFYLRTGNKLQPLQYNDVQWLGADLLLVELALMRGVIHPNGTGILPAQYDEILRLPDLLLARKGKQWSAFSLDGKPKKELTFKATQQLQTQYLRSLPAAAPPIVRIATQDGEQYQLLELADGAYSLSKAQNHPLHYTTGNIAFIENTGAFFPFELDKQQQRSVRYDAIRALTRSAWAVKQNGKWGILHSDGKELLPCQYDTLYTDANFEQFLYLNQAGKHSLYELEKRTVLFAERDLPIVALSATLFAMSEKSSNSTNAAPARYQLQNIGSAKMPAMKWEGVLYLSATHFAAQEKGLWGVYDLSGQVLLKPQYAAIRKQMGGTFHVSDDGKNFYYVNAQNKKLPCLKD